MPDFNDLASIADVTRPDTADRSGEERAALRAVLWRVERGHLTAADAATVLEALGLIEPTVGDGQCRPLSRSEIATANRRAAMARLRAEQARDGGSDGNEGAA